MTLSRFRVPVNSPGNTPEFPQGAALNHEPLALPLSYRGMPVDVSRSRPREEAIRDRDLLGAAGVNRCSRCEDMRIVRPTLRGKATHRRQSPHPLKPTLLSRLLTVWWSQHLVDATRATRRRDRPKGTT